MQFSSDLPGSSVVKTVLPIQGLQIQPLVSELRPHLLCSAAKKVLKKRNLQNTFGLLSKFLS